MNTSEERLFYSNIFQAEDERAAALQYLAECKEEPTEKNIIWKLRSIREIIPEEEPEKLMDCSGNEIIMGCHVVFVRNKAGEASRLMKGYVIKITGNKSITVRAEDGESVRILPSKKETGFLSKVIVIKKRPERELSKFIDASGYPIYEGDPVVYMKDGSRYYCERFSAGIVREMNEETVAIDSIRRAPERLVVVNYRKPHKKQ